MTAPTSDAENNGEWSALEDWPLIAIHAMVLPDGKVLTFGTDERGMQSGEFIYDVWDPVTGEHFTIENTTGTDIFCSNMAILPATGEIIIAGGDNRPNGGVNRGVDDVNIYDFRDMSLTTLDGQEMNYARWYQSTITLGDGSILSLGGRDENAIGVGTPEVYLVGEGWTELTGAASSDIAQKWWYPRTWVNADGDVIVVESRGGANQADVFVLDVSGTGSMTKISALPFATRDDTPSIMYDEGKILIMATNGELWSMDINGAQPTYTKVGDVGQSRLESNMSVLPDGTVAITGGSRVDNKLTDITTEVAIWNPVDNSVTIQDDEALARLYHSTGLLLLDGSVASLGGGAPGPLTNTNGQIFYPKYLYDNDGNLAERPEILDAPLEITNTEEMFITVDDAGAIARLTFLRQGAVTHSRNNDSRFLELEFEVINDTTIRIDPPDNPNVMLPGFWMLFALDGDGVPSVAKMVGINVGGEGFDPNFVDGTSGADDLIGTEADDVIDGAGGGDLFRDTKGNDTYIGEEGIYDLLYAEGAAADYVFQENSDGTVSMYNSETGHDILDSIEGIWFRGAREWFRVGELLAPTEGLIEGTSGNDVLYGSTGDDTMIGNGGSDVFRGSLGDDDIIGNDGEYDELSLAGSAADYTFTANGDGSITLTGDLVGTDTLTSIDGVWFRGAQQWSNINDLLDTPGGLIEGTAGDEILFGSDGEDTMIGNGGSDVFRGSLGNDTIIGDAGVYDELSLAGSAADYAFIDNGDGTVTVTGDLIGTDTLEEIDGVWFRGAQEWYSIADLFE